MILAQRVLHRRGEPARDRRQRGAQDHPAAVPCGRRGGTVERCRRAVQQLLGSLRERRAGGSQRDAFGMAGEQGDAQLALEPSDVTGERRLCDARFAGRATQVPRDRNRDEILQIPQVHRDGRSIFCHARRAWEPQLIGIGIACGVLASVPARSPYNNAASSLGGPLLTDHRPRPTTPPEGGAPVSPVLPGHGEIDPRRGGRRYVTARNRALASQYRLFRADRGKRSGGARGGRHLPAANRPGSHRRGHAGAGRPRVDQAPGRPRAPSRGDLHVGVHGSGGPGPGAGLTGDSGAGQAVYAGGVGAGAGRCVEGRRRPLLVRRSLPRQRPPPAHRAAGRPRRWQCGCGRRPSARRAAAAGPTHRSAPPAFQ